MPLIYLPHTGTDPQTVVSADGVVTAVTDPTNASVLLRVDLPGVDEVSITCTDTLTGQVRQVRSGTPALVTGGVGFAYDHEAMPGRALAYTVTADEATFGPVVVTLPWLDVSCDAWVKCPADPSLSRRVRILAPLDETYQGRTHLTSLLGVGAAHATWDVEGGWAATVTLATDGETETRDLSALLAWPGTLLLQATDDHGLPGPLHVARVDRQVVRAADLPGWRGRRQVVSLVETRAPAVTGAPMRMPRWGWAEAVAPYTSMSQVQAAYPTHWDMLLAGVGQ